MLRKDFLEENSTDGFTKIFQFSNVCWLVEESATSREWIHQLRQMRHTWRRCATLLRIGLSQKKKAWLPYVVTTNITKRAAQFTANSSALLISSASIKRFFSVKFGFINKPRQIPQKKSSNGISICTSKTNANKVHKKTIGREKRKWK